MPYRKARNSTDDHYAAPVTIYVNGCVLEACRIEASRLKWARWCGKDRIMCESAIAGDIGPSPPSWFWVRLAGTCRGM